MITVMTYKHDGKWYVEVISGILTVGSKLSTKAGGIFFGKEYAGHDFPSRRSAREALRDYKERQHGCITVIGGLH